MRCVGSIELMLISYVIFLYGIFLIYLFWTGPFERLFVDCHLENLTGTENENIKWLCMYF